MAKKEVSNRVLLDLESFLLRRMKATSSVKLDWCLGINYRRIKEPLDELRRQMKNELVAGFEATVRDIKIECAIKDDDGVPRRFPSDNAEGWTYLPEDIHVQEEKIKAYREENPDVDEAVIEHNERAAKILDETVAIDFHTISISKISEGQLSQGAMVLLGDVGILVDED